MFCPACGVKNEGGGLKCFVCKKVLPSLEAPVDRGPRRTRFVHVTSNAAAAAAVGDRMIALLLDRALLAAVALTISASDSGRVTRFRDTFTTASVISIVAGLAFVAAFVYHVLLESTFGATLGKAILGLTVRNESDRNRFVAVCIRNAMRIVDGIGFYAVGFFVGLFSPRKQRIGDFVAGTVVLEQRIHWGSRAVFLALWLAIVGVCVWLAWSFCPTCVRF